MHSGFPRLSAVRPDPSTGDEWAIVPVVVVYLHETADLAPLLDVRATTLRVISPGRTRRYILDEIPAPQDVRALARTLANEPWCAGAEVFWAVGASTSKLHGDLPEVVERAGIVIEVKDPVLGRLAYALFSTHDAACAALTLSAR